MTAPARPKSIGECIYCGAKEYEPGTGKRLAAEHIVPRALNGHLTLLEASCRACEQITGVAIEGDVLGQHLIGPRAVLRLRSKKKSLGKPMPLFVGPYGTKPVMIPPEDYPSALLLPYLPDPPILRVMLGHGLGSYYHEPFVHWLRLNPEVLKAKYGVTTFAIPAVNMLAFCRMIAKIGHAWAVEELGVSGFVPFLKEHLRDPDLDSRAILPFVGGKVSGNPTKNLHEVRLLPFEFDSIKYIVTQIRLFALLGAPTYVVLVGVESGQPPVRLPNISVGADVLRKFCGMLSRPW